jgi:hypothetical protein
MDPSQLTPPDHPSGAYDLFDSGPATMGNILQVVHTLSEASSGVYIDDMAMDCPWSLHH